MTEFLKSCAEKDTLTAEDRKRLVEVADKVAEVVHCVDCKFLGIKDMVYGYCKKNMCGIIKPDDYCSQGQKAR